MADAAVRTEQATPKRRADARRQGQVVVSSEIAPVAVLLAVIVLATIGAPLLVSHAGAVLREWLAAAGPAATGDAVVAPLAWRGARALGVVLVPFFCCVGLVGAGAVVAQVGWHPSPELVRPDARRIAFATGWARLVSLDGLANLLKAVAKVALLVAIGGRMLAHLGVGALEASSLPVDGILAMAGGGLRELGLLLAAALVVVGAGDYAWARWRHEQALRMSRHELREELRQSDGDPQVRRRFRRAHHDLAKRRMLADVAGADVVIGDPADVAVALRYRAGEGRAARVLAKGAGELARTIADRARAAGVPLVERRALARALGRAVPIGGEIPPSLYRAVAEVLAYVYSRGGREASP